MKDIKKIFYIKEKKEKSLFTLGEVLVISLVFSVVIGILTGYTVYNFKGNIIKPNGSLDDIINTYQKISDEYYEKVDMNDISDAAISGMMNYLDEKYSVYMDENDSLNLNDKLKGNYEGIGISIYKNNKKEIVILDVFDSSPAKKAGLKKNDIIIRVNDLEINENTSSDKIVNIIKKEKMTKIYVKRDGEVLTFDVSKEVIDYPVVNTKIFKREDKNIGYIELSSFNDSATKQFKKGLKDLEKKGIDSLIIDLRGNTGGYLNVCNDIASMFLKKGKIVYSLEGKTTRNIIYDETKEERTYDIVVLIDSHTASASEILASALKESYGAVLVGMPSYGKGKVQQTSTLSDDEMIKYTTGKWFTPSGDTVDSVGLTPGFIVPLTKKYALSPTDENDDQLQKGLEYLSKIN